MSKTKAKYMPKPPDCADLENSLGYKPVAIGYVKGAFFVLIGGQVIALLIVCAEYVISFSSKRLF